MLDYNLNMRKILLLVITFIILTCGQNTQAQDTNEFINNTPQPTKEIKNSQHNEQSIDQLDEIENLRDQARFLYNTNKLQEAQNLFTQIPDSQKTSEDWMILANIAQDNKKEIDAVFYLKKAIQINEKNYKAHYNLGNIYFADNKINAAINEYKKAIKIKKDFSYAYYNKGCCYLKKESYINARYDFGLAIKVNPNEPAFYYNLAYTNKMMKKHKKSKEALEMYNMLMQE
jgi:tetratricopeptide (TPR) repeat protein